VERGICGSDEELHDLHSRQTLLQALGNRYREGSQGVVSVLCFVSRFPIFMTKYVP